MNKSKKEKNSIIVSFSFFFLLTLTLTFVIIFKIIPGIVEVEKLKESTLETYNTIKQKQISGISFEEFESMKGNFSSGNEDELYISEVLANIDGNFFNKNLINTGSGTYNDFITELNKKYSDTSSIDKNLTIIGNILPIYTEGLSDLGGNYLSDFKFINYIESIGETFNISFSNPIGIGELEVVNNYAISTEDSSLEKNIYYIPLSLDIDGTKESIINFLYFSQKVGSISIEGDKIKVDMNIDNDFQEFKTKILKGQIRTPDYNIFNNHIFDIYSVTFDDYIDSSFDLVESNRNFITYIKNFQKNEDYSAKVELRFYVKGVPIYQIESKIRDFILDYGELEQDISSMLSKQDIPQMARIKLIDYKITLDQLNTSLMLDLRKSLGQKEDLEKSFLEVKKYQGLIQEYSEYLESLKK